MHEGTKVMIIDDHYERGVIDMVGILQGKTIYRVNTKDYIAWFYDYELMEVKK